MNLESVLVELGLFGPQRALLTQVIAPTAAPSLFVFVWLLDLSKHQLTS